MISVSYLLREFLSYDEAVLEQNCEFMKNSHMHFHFQYGLEMLTQC